MLRPLHSYRALSSSIASMDGHDLMPQFQRCLREGWACIDLATPLEKELFWLQDAGITILRDRR